MVWKPGGGPLGFLPEGVAAARSVQRAMHTPESIERNAREREEAPIFSGRAIYPKRDQNGYWRDRKGRFARKPKSGDRADMLGLKK